MTMVSKERKKASGEYDAGFRLGAGRCLLALGGGFFRRHLALPRLQRLDGSTEFGDLRRQRIDVLLRRHAEAIQRTRYAVFKHLLELVPRGVGLGGCRL